MRKIKLSQAKQAQLDSIKQSRPRPLMPSPKVFADKSKYNRKREKEKLLREQY